MPVNERRLPLSSVTVMPNSARRSRASPVGAAMLVMATDRAVPATSACTPALPRVPIGASSSPMLTPALFAIGPTFLKAPCKLSRVVLLLVKVATSLSLTVPKPLLATPIPDIIPVTFNAVFPRSTLFAVASFTAAGMAFRMSVFCSPARPISIMVWAARFDVKIDSVPSIALALLSETSSSALAPVTAPTSAIVFSNLTATLIGAARVSRNPLPVLAICWPVLRVASMLNRAAECCSSISFNDLKDFFCLSVCRPIRSNGPTTRFSGAERLSFKLKVKRVEGSTMFF